MTIFELTKFSMKQVFKLKKKAGSGPGFGVYLFFLKKKERGFRVWVRVSVNPNLNPKTAFFRKKKVDPGPAFY